jgi:hypothetical protein
MDTTTNISKVDYLKESIFDTLDIIERANRSIERHTSIVPQDTVAISGFARLRQQQAAQLDNLIAEFGLHLAKQTTETGEYQYDMAS